MVLVIKLRLATRVTLAATGFAVALLFGAASANAATCPFDAGASDALNAGVVLNRYTLGITGRPITASTRYASRDPLQVKNNVECVGRAMDMYGDGQIDTVDTRIIARLLAGCQGASLTGGPALGVGTGNMTALVAGFLANGAQNAQDIPRRVVAVPLSAWNYLAGDPFWQALGWGSDDIPMTFIEARGVKLAAIQGLNHLLSDEVNAKTSRDGAA